MHRNGLPPCRRAGLLLAALAITAAADASPPPWQRSEPREPCASFATLRSPYFGDLHVHTRYSADAYIFGTRVDPRGAYDFARGGPIMLADENEAQTRSARIDRPLDFAAVTDHSEFFGEVYVCSTPGVTGYDDELCGLLRQAEPVDEQFQTTVRWLFPAGIANPPRSHSFCFESGVDCDARAVSVWLDMQAAAEEAYDRTATCRFTSLLGYEHTSSPAGRHLHRNIIFRNAHVPPFPKSHLETVAGGIPQGVWSAVETDCLGAGDGCDAVIIPHNPNLSGGEQWLDPADAAEAARRQRLEPLVEMHQIKGNSECRFDRLAGIGAGTADELCTFEQDPFPHQLPGRPPPAIAEYPLRNMVRNTLKDGLALEARLGVNPFQLGFIGSSDTHNATAGNSAEVGWPGGQGANDSSPAFQIGRELRTNPGGLAVVWAEENSRDAIFAALRRRETYATSGTRPVVRFFGGDYRGLDCGESDLLRRAYAEGVPMGAELSTLRGDRSPRFIVWAVKDPGTDQSPGTDLARLQVVKGWVDRKGRTRERVFDVARASGEASVDPATCNPVGRGASELCTIWRDPTFNARERAFYYARVLENPTCRWSTRVCKQVGVDPFSPDCVAQAAVAGAAFTDCCRDERTDAFLSPVIQERAWSSPIWHRPETIARLTATLTFGASPETDVLELRLRIGRLPRDLDLAVNDLTVRITDDDEIYRVTIPAGTLGRRGRGRLLLVDDAGSLAGLRFASLTGVRGGAGVLKLRIGPRDLARADRTEHMVTVALESGLYRAAHTRLWSLRNGQLVSP